MTSGLVKSCNKKCLLYKKYIKNPSTTNKDTYVRYRNKLKSLLIKAEKDFYRIKFQQFQGNLSLTWKLIKTVLNKNKQIDIVKEFVKDGSVINDPREIVEHFNYLFTNIGENLEKSIPAASTTFSSHLKSTESYKNSFALFLTMLSKLLEL